jgi:hypothetical protein
MDRIPLLLAAMFDFGKIITLVYINFTSVLLTMQGKQAQLFMFGILQCIPVILLSIMITHLSDGASLVIYLLLSSFISTIYYHWELREFANRIK